MLFVIFTIVLKLIDKTEAFVIVKPSEESLPNDVSQPKGLFINIMSTGLERLILRGFH